MEPQTLELLVDGDQASGWVVRAPAVGLWRGLPEDGLAIDGAHAGTLTQGNRRRVLRLPAGVRGVVRDSPRARLRSLGVEWGQTLFRLEPIGESAAGAAARASATTAAADVFPSPTDGVFYTRPSPTAEPFVKPGDVVKRGQPVGLIEVMKTFTQVLFDEDSLPDPAVVEEVLVEDGTEVKAGTPLLRVRGNRRPR